MGFIYFIYITRVGRFENSCTLLESSTTVAAAAASAPRPSGPSWRRAGPVWGAASGASWGTAAAVAAATVAMMAPLWHHGTVAPRAPQNKTS